MGNAIATNISNEIIQSMVNSSNSALQNCQVDDSQIQTEEINGVTGGTFYNDWSQKFVLRTDCSSDDKFQNTVSTSIQQKAQQLAKSISQQFELSSAESANISNELANLSVQVSNSFIQNCYTSGIQLQVVVVQDATNVVVNNNLSQYNETVANCVSKDQAVNSTIENIQQAVSQTATSTVESFLSGLIGVIIAIFALIGIIIFFPKGRSR